MTAATSELMFAEGAAELMQIARLGPATEEGFRAAISFGRELIKENRRISFLLGDLAVLVAPDIGKGGYGAGITERQAKDRDRLNRLATAIEVDYNHFKNLRRVALFWPPAHRYSGMGWTAHMELCRDEVQGLEPSLWMSRFVAEHGRVPRLSEVREATGTAKVEAIRAVKKASAETQAEIVADLVTRTPEAAERATEILATAIMTSALSKSAEIPSLDGAGSSVTLSMRPEVADVEKALGRIIETLIKARDDVATIAASSSAAHIAMLARHAAEEASALADVLSLDPSKV